MKKVIFMFCMAMSLFATNAFAQMQEVRGIETRRVVYEGPRYSHYDNYYTTYYGFEFHNMNSVSVSVDIELYLQKDGTDSWGKQKPDELITTKTVVLRPGETYVFKRESDQSFRKGYRDDGYSIGGHSIQEFYVTYKAYKLQ